MLFPALSLRYLKRLTGLFLGTLFVCSGAPLRAEETRHPVVTLEPITVTAQREDTVFQTGDVDLEQTTAFFSVIEREQFEGRIESLSEVIEKEAGIQVRQSGGLGSFSTVSLRGSDSDQVMVFMDGILLNDASGGGVDLSNISLSDIEAIEIYRGITPINFGKASIGGVVNIRTLRARKGLKANANAGYGSFDTTRFSGLINHKPGRWDYLVSADYLSSDNDFRFRNDRGTEWNPDDDRWENRQNNQFEQQGILTKGGFDFTDSIRLDASNQWFAKDQHLPNWSNSRSTNATYDVRRNNTFLKCTVDNVTPLLFNLSGRFYYSWKEEEYDDRKGAIGLGRQHNEYETNKYGAHLFLEWPTTWQTLTIITEVYREEYELRDLLRPDDPGESRRDVFSFGLQDSFFLFDNALVVTPGFHFQALDDELRSSVDQSGNILEGESERDNYASPQVGLMYRVSTWLTLKLNVARYARKPSFSELFGDHGFFIANPDLEAEEGLNWDVGFDFHWKPYKPWLRRISLSSAFFRSEVDDLITTLYDARGIGKAVNIADATIKGVESSVVVEGLKFFRLIGNITWQDTENRGSIQAFNGKKLPGRFEKSFLGRLEATYRTVKVYGEYVYESDLFYDAANLLEAKTKKEINMGICWLFRSWLFSFEGKNLSNDRYEDFNGYPLPGRAFYFTMKYDFA